MSLINEALKQARNQTSEPPGSEPLGIPVYDAAPKKSLRRDIVVILMVCAVLIVLLGGALFGILYTQFNNKNSAAKPSETGTVPTAASGAATPAAPALQQDPPAATSSLGKAREKATVTFRKVAEIHREMDEPLPLPATPAPAATGTTPALAPAASPAAVPAAATPTVPGNTVAPVVAAAVAPGLKPAAAPAPSPAVTQLKAKLKLTGIIGKPGAFMALLNNRLVRKGDEIEGATVIDITADQVLLNLNGEAVEVLIRPAGL